LCVLGKYLRQIGFFEPLERRVHLEQKVLKYTPIQKLEMLFVGVLSGIKAVSHTMTSVRVDVALTTAFGLPGCAEQSVLADTLDAASEADVADLQAALAELFEKHSQVRQHPFDQDLLVLDVDLSPLPASKHAEGSERGYLGRSRSKTGRKLVRVRAAATGEIVWETVISARSVESLPLLQEAIQAAELVLGLAGDSSEAQRKRARTEIRLDSSWGSEAIITWLLERGYHVMGKFKSNSRVRKLVSGITTWSATSSPGREVAAVPEPVEFVRPLSQYAVRTPSKEQKSGYYHAIVFTSRTELSMQEVVDHYDGRAGIEADLKGDKHGLGLATIRKHRLAAQTIVILLLQLAHNVLLWARQWLGQAAPRLHDYGIVRLISQVWAIPGRVKLTEQGLQRVRLRRAHPRAPEVCRGFRPLLLTHHLEELLH
jgi:Transposase DDE domain group 1